MTVRETKSKIIDVAGKLFHRFGFYKTSMDEIAKIARKAKGSLYYHYENKEAVFKEVLKTEIMRIREQLHLLVYNSSLGAKEKLRTYVEQRMRLLKKAYTYREALRSDFANRLDFVDELRSDFDKWERANLTHILKEGIEKKEFSLPQNIDQMLDSLLFMIKGVEIESLILTESDSESSLSNLMQTISKGLSK